MEVEQLAVLQKEIELIKSPTVRLMVYRGLMITPEYVLTVPASASGKYHPKFAQGEGGLMRHIRATTVIAEELFAMNEYKFWQIEKDLIYASLILHDNWKQGYDEAGKTMFFHPDVAADELIRGHVATNVKEKFLLRIICGNIRSHMGQWNTHPKPENYPRSRRGHLLKPITRMQKFVHLCDFLASRKPIEITLR